MLNTDKLAHCAAGAVATLIFGLLVSVPAGVAAAVLIGALKELYDARGHGTPDGLDFLATITGGVTAALLLH